MKFDSPISLIFSYMVECVVFIILMIFTPTIMNNIEMAIPKDGLLIEETPYVIIGDKKFYRRRYN